MAHGEKDSRIVEAIRAEYAVGLQLLDRFKVGDRVAHISRGDGFVTEKTDGPEGAVTIIFDERRKDGSPTVGIYNAIWFNEHPTFLFHRGTQPLQARPAPATGAGR